uniref:Uncharacterized protein n=1 Tax=Glossina austeni TaxID=7395 RepID=A0A1A9VDY4_GLOAU
MKQLEKCFKIPAAVHEVPKLLMANDPYGLIEANWRLFQEFARLECHFTDNTFLESSEKWRCYNVLSFYIRNKRYSRDKFGVLTCVVVFVLMRVKAIIGVPLDLSQKLYAALNNKLGLASVIVELCNVFLKIQNRLSFHHASVIKPFLVSVCMTSCRTDSKSYLKFELKLIIGIRISEHLFLLNLLSYLIMDVMITG